MVNARIADYMKRKTEMLQNKQDEHDKIKEIKVQQLIDEKEAIMKKKGDYETEIEKISNFIDLEEQEREKRNNEEREKEEKLERERQMKIEMEDAARYI